MNYVRMFLRIVLLGWMILLVWVVEVPICWLMNGDVKEANRNIKEFAKDIVCGRCVYEG